MKIKNVMAILLLVFTVGLLFSGCSSTDTDVGDNNITNEDNGNGNSVPEEENVENQSSSSSSEEVDEVVEEDNINDSEVEIGSLI